MLSDDTSARTGLTKDTENKNTIRNNFVFIMIMFFILLLCKIVWDLQQKRLHLESLEVESFLLPLEYNNRGINADTNH